MNGTMGTRLLHTTNPSASNPWLDCWALRATMLDAAHMAAAHRLSTSPQPVMAAPLAAFRVFMAKQPSPSAASSRPDLQRSAGPLVQQHKAEEWR
jgi:hypothetical protein